MEYTVEDISPVKKKAAVTVDKEEVNSSLSATTAMYKNTVNLAGFRKGKVPLRLIEQRYHDAIYQEARMNLINVHIAKIMGDETVEIVGGLNVEPGGEFERDKDYHYTIEFDTFPQFELPNYEGLDVEVDKGLLPEKASLDDLIENVRKKAGKLVPVTDTDHVGDGQYANVDFTFSDHGNVIKELDTKNFLLKIGDNQVLPAFETLVKSVAVGKEGEAEITFPEDFLNKEYQGKTMLAKVRLNAIKKMEYPEINDDFAKSQNFASLASMKDSLRIGQEKGLENLTKNLVQQKMVDVLLKMVDFPLPPSLVRAQQTNIIQDMAMSLERQGKSIDEYLNNEELLKQITPRAEYYVRSTILLRTIAQKEGLQVTEKEVSEEIMRLAHRTGQDYNELRKQLEGNGGIFMIRDSLWADKGADLIFARGKYTLVDKAPETEKSEQKADADQKTASAETSQA
ncbi:MAG: trigger factor [Desulfovibrio sp.]|nr:trigger factor [Desulfovibrio sp.]